MAITSPTQITPPRVAIIDERTGAISREWYRFLLSLFTSTQDLQVETKINPDANALLASFDALLAELSQTVKTLPDANALLASFDELLAELSQTVKSAPDAQTAIAALDAKINDLAQSLATAPRAELGTLAAIQQDNVPWLQFNTIPQGFPTGPTANGTVYWDDADAIKTLNIVMEDSGEVVQHIGEETYYRVKASTAVTKGQVVMLTGSVGASGGLICAPATGLTAFENERILGLATQNIPLNGWGYVTWFGEVKKINTTGGAETWVDGDVLYYNPAVPGGLTKIVPSAPNPKVLVAVVVHAATNGILFVRPTFGSVLGATDSNVEITGLANSDLLQYDSVQARWENVPASSISTGTAANLSGGAANRIAYQTAPNVTGFIVAPTIADTLLQWSGSAFQWVTNTAGTVTSVAASGGTTGLSFTGSPITTSGTLTLGGTLAVANGGTGATSLTSGYLVKGNGTSAVSASVVYDDGTNVGIGTNSPDRKLIVSGSSVTMGLYATNGGNLAFDAPVAGLAQIDVSGVNAIRINTNATERMRIDSSGNVGIGTSSPAGKLHTQLGTSFTWGSVWSASTAVFGGGSSSAGGLGIAYNDTGGAAMGSIVPGVAWKDFTLYSNALVFNTNGGNERMRIDTIGNVGIGVSTIATDAALQLYRPAGIYTTLKLSNGNTGAGNLDGFDLVVGLSSEAYVYNRENSYMVFGTNNTERVRITSAGDVGIGTSSPQALLDVNGNVVHRSGVYFAMTAPTTKAAAATLTGAEVVQGYIQYTGAAATLTMPTGTNLQAAMPSNVATLNDIAFDFTIINTGSGTATLAVNTNITAVGALTTATNTATTFHIRKTATNTFIIYRT